MAIAALAPALTLLGACGGIRIGPSHGGNVTLRVVTTDYSGLKTGSDVTAYWRGLAAGFERDNPHIKVDIEPVPVADVNNRVASMVRQGHAPDMAQTDSYSAFATKGELYPADALFPVSMQAEFISSLADAGSLDNVEYAVPWVAGTRMFFYNKKLFARAHIDAAPRTWDELRADAEKLKAAGVPVPVGLPLGPQEAEAETMMWMLGGDGGYTDVSGRYAFDSDANVATFSWLKAGLVDAGLVGPRDPAKTNVSDAFGDFLAGRTGMLDGHITLLARGKAAGIDIGVAPLPGRSGPSSQTLGNADWMMAFKQPGHLDADAKFLQFVYGKANMLTFQHGNGLLPVTADTTQEVWTNPAARPLLPFMRLLPDAAFYPVDKPSWTAVSQQLRKVIGQAVHGSPAKVLTDLQTYATAADPGRP
jgi:multiple sugar transport system substrate-binding protein